jgi:amino acid permease
MLESGISQQQSASTPIPLSNNDPESAVVVAAAAVVVTTNSFSKPNNINPISNRIVPLSASTTTTNNNNQDVLHITDNTSTDITANHQNNNNLLPHDDGDDRHHASVDSSDSSGTNSKGFLLHEPNHYNNPGMLEIEIEDLAPPKTATWSTAGWLMVADVVGAGVMALSTAFGNVGWFWGFLSSTAWFIANMYVGIIILECRTQWPHAHSFMDLSYFAFGYRAKQITGFAVYSLLAFILGDYILIMGECLQRTFYDSGVCPVIWTFIAMIFLLPLMQYRLLANVRILLYFNVVTILLAVFITLIQLTVIGQTGTLTMTGGTTEFIASNMTFKSFTHAQSLNSFAYSGVFVYLEIISEMKEPQQFKKSLLCLSGPFQYVLYLTVGAWGYAFLGSSANGLLVGNIPKGVTYRLASIALFIHILFTYLVKGIVLARALHRFVSPSSLNDFTVQGHITYALVTAFILAFTFVIANLVPFFDDLTALIGALQMPLIGFIMPFLYVLKARKYSGKKTGKIELGAMIIISFTMVILFFAGTVGSIQTILSKWQSYGTPFSC